MSSTSTLFFYKIPVNCIKIYANYSRSARCETKHFLSPAAVPKAPSLATHPPNYKNIADNMSILPRRHCQIFSVPDDVARFPGNVNTFFSIYARTIVETTTRLDFVCLIA